MHVYLKTPSVLFCWSGVHCSIVKINVVVSCFFSCMHNIKLSCSMTAILKRIFNDWYSELLNDVGRFHIIWLSVSISILLLLILCGVNDLNFLFYTYCLIPPSISRIKVFNLVPPTYCHINIEIVFYLTKL